MRGTGVGRRFDSITGPTALGSPSLRAGVASRSRMAVGAGSGDALVVGALSALALLVPGFSQITMTRP